MNSTACHATSGCAPGNFSRRLHFAEQRDGGRSRGIGRASSGRARSGDQRGKPCSFNQTPQRSDLQAPATGAGTSASAAAGPAAKPASNELVLQVAATERAWVSLDADGKMVFQRVLNPNEVQTFHADKGFDLTVGNAQSVILTLNGETLKPLGRRGEVKSIHLTHDDLKNTTP